MWLKCIRFPSDCLRDHPEMKLLYVLLSSCSVGLWGFRLPHIRLLFILFTFLTNFDIYVLHRLTLSSVDIVLTCFIFLTTFLGSIINLLHFLWDTRITVAIIMLYLGLKEFQVLLSRSFTIRLIAFMNILTLIWNVVRQHLQYRFHIFDVFFELFKWFVMHL